MSVYEARGRPMTMAYWRLPAEAHDDADALRRWAALGRAAAVEAKKTARA